MGINIYEVKRKTLIKYTNTDTPKRVKRGKRLHYRFVNFDETKLRRKYDGMFVGVVSGGARSHETFILVHQLLENIRQFMLVHDKTINQLTNMDMVSIVAEAIKENDVEVFCDCEDFQYRFAYTATLKNYNVPGREEKRPAKETNPRNKGALCKHLVCTFNNNSFIRRAVPQILRELKSNEKFYLSQMNLENV